MCNVQDDSQGVRICFLSIFDCMIYFFLSKPKRKYFPTHLFSEIYSEFYKLDGNIKWVDIGTYMHS